jgi:hypothetical protein
VVSGEKVEEFYGGIVNGSTLGLGTNLGKEWNKNKK